MENQTQTNHWLTASAIWALVTASATLNAWGWAQTPGLIAGVLVVLAISAEILGARLFLHAERSPAARGRIVLFLLAAGCVAFNAVSGHRAFSAAESRRLAPAIAAARDAESVRIQSIRADIFAAQAEIDRTPRCDLSRPGPQYQAACSAAWLAAVQPARARIAALTAALDAPQREPELPESLPNWLLWSIVALIEALKSATFWGLGMQRRAESGTKRLGKNQIEEEISARVAKTIRNREIAEKRLATMRRNKRQRQKTEALA